jgi:chemotaxis regulatin CheY-phosphate phosphatase CheZ
MATSRIKIEVDFDNAVAKIDQLKVGFREIGERTVEARDRILKMVTATKVAADGSVKALQREKAAWQQIQASLSTTNQEYRKYQVQIDALDKQINKITDTRKREEIALKNSANGIKQQIALFSRRWRTESSLIRSTV